MTVVTVLESLAVALLLALSSAWGLFHPRRVLEQRTAALRDAFWVTVAFFFLFRSALMLGGMRLVAESNPRIESVIAPLSSGALCLLVFPALFFFNLNLVALTGFVLKKDLSAERHVLSLFWPVFALCLLADIGLRNLRYWPTGFASVGTPFWTLLILAKLRRHNLDATYLAERFTALLHRKCTFQRGGRLWDLRGVVLGVIAGGFVLLLPPLLLSPYRGAAYVSAIQFGSNLQTISNLMDRVTDGRVRPALQITLPQRSIEAFQEIVLIRFDASTRRATLDGSTSEALVEAQLLRKIAPLKPRAIVLSLPPESSDEIPPPLSTTEARPSDGAIRHNRAHLPNLSLAVHDASCVFVYSSPTHLPTGEISKLAQGYGTSALTFVDASNISAIQSPPEGAITQPLPFILDTSHTHPRGQPVLIDYRTDLHEIRVPLMVSQVLKEERLYDTVTEKWVPAKAFFPGKTVFIEAATPRYLSTPLGMRSEAEVLAQATATLLSGASLTPISAGIGVLMVLGLAGLVGHLSVGRMPLESLWRCALPVLLVVGGAFGATAFSRYYVDPVTPLCGALFALLVVTQFTFALQRGERDRNRTVLRRFLAPQVIEQVIDDPETKLGLGGKRRPVVVLFADVRGFSRFAESRTPEEVVATMNRYLTAMTEVLYQHEGILDKYTGDGLMALFPVEVEADDVARAVRAAIAMAQSVQQVAATLHDEGGDELAVGIGLHYGEAVVGLVGHPTGQANYTALGHTVVVAARLQTLAAGGEVILSDAVFRILPPGMVEVEPGESVLVKGVAQPIPIFRLKVSNPSNR